MEAEARRATQIYSSGVADESDKLRAARRYPEAIALLQTGANLDPSLRGQLDATAREYEGWKAAEHDRYNPATFVGKINVPVFLAGAWVQAQRGIIGPPNHRHFSFMGSITAPGRLMVETAPEVAKKLKEDGADWVLLTPV